MNQFDFLHYYFKFDASGGELGFFDMAEPTEGDSLDFYPQHAKSVFKVF